MTKTEKYNFLETKNLFFIAVTIAFVTAINIYAGMAIGGMAAGYIVYLLFGEEALVAFTIVTFLSVTEYFGKSVRLVVQLVNFGLLIFLFVKRYGTQFQKYPKTPKKINIFLLLLYSAFFLSFIFTPYKSYAIPQIVRTSVFLLLVYLYYSLINSERDLNLIFNTIIGITVYFAFYLIYELYASNFDLLNLNQKLFSVEANPYIDKNTYAIYFAVSIPLLIVRYISSKTVIVKSILFFLILFFSMGLIITNSRSIIMALFLSSIYLLYKVNRRYLVYMLLLFFIVVPFIFIEPIWTWVELYLRVEKISTGRDLIWKTLLNIPWKYYLLGMGPGATQYYMWNYIPFHFGSPEQLWMDYYFKKAEYGHAHNFYLFYLSDLGILGLSSAFYIVGAFFSYVKKIDFWENKKYRIYGYGLATSGIAIFIRSIFEWSGILSYGGIGVDLPFWIVLILLFLMQRNFK